MQRLNHFELAKIIFQGMYEDGRIKNGDIHTYFLHNVI